MNNYEIIKVIGEGAYGVVLKAKRRENGEFVAIKKFKESDDDELIKKTIVREMTVLRSLEHRNIVELREAFRKGGLVHLVFEYLDNNLLELLNSNQHGLPNKVIARCIFQVLEGLQYMHSLNYVHRDIKPENLLVNTKGILKICDMGFAKVIRDQMTDYVATRWYRPP
jgi:cyclin-dependent kinase-like